MELSARLAAFCIFLSAPVLAAEPAASPTPSPVAAATASATPAPAPTERPALDPGITGLEAMLQGNDPLATGGEGSFGYRLTSLGVSTYLKAYATAEWFNADDQPNTFDMHYFNIFVGADIQGKIYPEVQLEHEHIGSDSEIRIRFAQVDLRLAPWATVRLGSFLVPIGAFNEFLYPEFINRVADRPFIFEEGVVPEAWHEAGVQLRGQVPVWRDVKIDYAAFVVNGLTQADDPTTPAVEQGGLISYDYGFFSPAADPNNNKAVGGRLGFEPMHGVTLGVSGYTGAYTVDGKENLRYVGAHASFDRYGVTFYGELVRADEQITGGTIVRQGGYAQLSYKIREMVEPVVQFDGIRFDDPVLHDKDRWTFGLNLYPWPHDNPYALLKLDYEVGRDHEKPSQELDKFIAQFAIGF